MPSKKMTTATLEHQAESQTTADDESWRDQTIPTFDIEADPNVEASPFELAGEAKWQSREQVLAALDARSERLNGHNPEPEVKQPTLPSMPRRVVRPPQDAEFDGDFITSQDIGGLAKTLIARHPQLAYLEGARVIYVWKRRGGKSGGNRTLGKCQKPAGLLRHFSGADYVVWIAADHARDLGFAPREIEAVTFHELLHTEWIEEDEDTGKGHFGLCGHDFEGFVAELDAYGPWQANLREMHAHVARLPLLEAIEAQTTADQGDGEDEGDE